MEIPVEAASMEQIARLSGIPRSTLYYRYANKAEILQELVEAMLADLEVSISEALASGGLAVDRLAAVVRAQLQHLASNPALSRALLANLGAVSEVVDLLSSVNGAFVQPVRAMFDEGRRDGSLVVTDPELASEALYGAVLIVGLRRLMADGHIAVDALAAGLIEMFIERDDGPESRPVRTM